MRSAVSLVLILMLSVFTWFHMYPGPFTWAGQWSHQCLEQSLPAVGVLDVLEPLRTAWSFCSELFDFYHVWTWASFMVHHTGTSPLVLFAHLFIGNLLEGNCSRRAVTWGLQMISQQILQVLHGKQSSKTNSARNFNLVQGKEVDL